MQILLLRVLSTGYPLARKSLGSSSGVCVASVVGLACPVVHGLTSFATVLDYGTRSFTYSRRGKELSVCEPPRVKVLCAPPAKSGQVPL